MRKLLAATADRLLWNLSNHIMRKRYDVACIDAREILPRLLPRVAGALDTQRAQGGLSHNFSELKLLEFAGLLWQFRPQTVLELGGGATTAVLAEYAASFPGVKVVSVDESSHYLAATQERLPLDLQEKINFVHCQRIETDDSDGIRTCYYDSNWQEMLPGCEIDFIYVDGPDTDDGHGGKLPCVDAVRLIDEGWKIGHVLFDVRFASARYCMLSGRFIGHVFHLHRNALAPANETWVVDEVRHHSWIEPGPFKNIEPKCKK